MLPPTQVLLDRSKPATTRRRVSREASELPLPPAAADEPILRALARYCYLTAEQLLRLHYSSGSRTYVRDRLAGLVDRKRLLLRLTTPHVGQRGASPYVFRLSTRGQRFLEQLGVPVVALPDERPYSYLYWRHTLALNDALIAAELLARADPSLSIARLVHERELKRAPARVTLPNGSTRLVIPDAYLEIHERERDGARWATKLIWELDMGSIERGEWSKRVQALVAYGHGPYQERFGRDALAIAILAVPGPIRRDELVRWTELELERMGRQTEGSWFCFAGVDPAKVSPEQLYRAPIWCSPFRDDPFALLPAGEVTIS